MPDNLELKEELCQKLKHLESFKWCICPDRLLSSNECSILAKVHYEKLDATVIEVEQGFYVIAFQSSQCNKKNTIDEDCENHEYNKIYHDDDFFEDTHNDKWVKPVFNIFDVPDLVSQVLKTL